MGTVALWVGEWTLLLFLIISIRSILFNYLSPGASLLHFSLHPISGRGWLLDGGLRVGRLHNAAIPEGTRLEAVVNKRRILSYTSTMGIDCIINYLLY